MKTKQALFALMTGACAAAMTFKTFAAPADLTPPAGSSDGSGSTAAPLTPEGANKAKGGYWQNFWSNDSLTGDWGGFRKKLTDSGVSFSGNDVTEVFGNWGGADQGVIVDGVLNAALDLDLEKITGFWKDATLHGNAFYIYGPSLSARYVGDFSTTSNIAGYNSVRLQELWLQQNFCNKRFSIRVGMMAADTEFFISDSAALFLSATFGAFNLIGTNFPSAPLYPISSPGVWLSVAPTSNFYLKGAVFGMDPNANAAGNNANGTHFEINDSDGAQIFLEAGWKVNQSPNDHGLIGTYKIGIFIQRGNHATWNLEADEPGTGRLSGKGTDYAVYGVADQEVYKRGASTISAFARGGFAPSNLSFVDGYADAGFNFAGFIPGRTKDIAGVAVAYSHVSQDFSRADERRGYPPSTSETVIEATYNIKLTSWWNLQPDFQYIVNPSGVKDSTDAVVLGLRTTLTF